jgi:protein involved in polysaccharide export with SLBB domain
MLKLKFIACAIIFCLLSVSSTFAQVPPITESQARAELDKLGMTEEDFRAKLMERGIDIDQIDLNKPSELARLQKAIEEIEAEVKGANNAKDTSNNNEGEAANVEDIVSEEVKEAATTINEISEGAIEGEVVESILADGIKEVKDEVLPPSTIYGQHIFRNKDIVSYVEGASIQASNSYVLGAGDKIGISLWGISELDAILEISKDGYIKPQGMSRINLKGITLGKAKQLLRSRFSNYYRFGKDQFEVTVTYPRPITIHIVGEVMNSGSFTMPAVNTAFNALAAAGGPSDIGSVRKIKIIRPSGKNKVMDIYEYLLDPTISKDYYLQDNDIIHVGVAEKLISVQGAVRRPFKYELEPNEQLKDLIKYAGGLQPNAYRGNFQVKRFVNDSEKIIDVNYGELVNSTSDFNLNGGDAVVIGTIPKPYKNFVEITGSVDLPGRYELEAGMKVVDLVDKGVLAEYAKTDLAYLLRTRLDGTISYSKISLVDAVQGGTDNLLLTPKDKLVVFSKQKYLDQYEVSINGAIRAPSKYKYDPSEKLTVEDLVILGGGLRRDATDFAYIYRTIPENTSEKEYIRIDIKNAIDNPDSPDNLVLQPNDQIQILSKLTYIDDFSVRVAGAVRSPGEYQYHPSLSLKDVLTLSGGLKMTASSNRIDIFRVVINNNELTKSIVATVAVDENLEMSSEFKLEPFDQIVVRSVPQFELQQFVTIEGEVKFPGPYALIDDNEKLTNLIKRAGGLTEESFPAGATLYREDGGTGFVVLRLDEALKSNNDIHNFILKKGDVITIPKQKDLVTITGATRAIELYPENIAKSGKINVAYHKRKRAKWYVDEYAAGIGDNGRSRLITVEYPNGEIKRTKNFLFFKVYPQVTEGSVVKVGVKPPKPPKAAGEKREKIDWGKTLADSLAQATAILSLVLLVQSLN